MTSEMLSDSIVNAEEFFKNSDEHGNDHRNRKELPQTQLRTDKVNQTWVTVKGRP